MTSQETIRLAAVAYDRGFDIDRLLVDVCDRLARRGVRLGGLLQISTGAKGRCAGQDETANTYIIEIAI